MRCPSDKECEKGGWIHRLDQPIQVESPKKKQREYVDMKPFLSKAAKEVDRLRPFARNLGVSIESLERLGCIVARGALGFPMLDIQDRPSGIQYRAMSGKKWSEKGGAAGLFRATDLLDKKRLVVVEGASDTAAAMTALPDEWIAGRPSNLSCVDMVAALLNKSIQLVIVADRDEEKQRPDGSWWNPGHYGALKLAKRCFELASTVKIIRPPGCKDMREWLTSGRLKPKSFHDTVAMANYLMPSDFAEIR
jgi:hypothetical protein